MLAKILRMTAETIWSSVMSKNICVQLTAKEFRVWLTAKKRGEKNAISKTAELLAMRSKILGFVGDGLGMSA